MGSFKIEVVGTPESIRVELWGDEGWGGFKELLPLNEVVAVPLYSSAWKAEQIRIYQINDYEIVGVAVNGELKNPWGGTRAKVTMHSSGLYWFINLDGVVEDNHGTNLISLVVEVIGGTSTVAPFNRLHLLDAAKVRELSAVAMQPVPVFSSTESHYLVDRSIYIINLLSIPFKIPDEYVGDDLSVKLGDYDTSIVAPVVITDSLTIPLGTIDMANLGSSVLDYKDVEYELILPFIQNTITLSADLVVGKLVSVDYVLDGYDGAVTVNVYNGGEEPIYSIASSVGRDIPIKTTKTIEGSLGSANGIDNEVLTAYIRITRPELAEGVFNNLVMVSGLIGESSGFIQVDEISLKTGVSLQERLNIVSLLKGGIYINA